MAFLISSYLIYLEVYMSKHIGVMSEPVLYDIFNANCVEDIEMYKKMCINIKQVLELGIGTGRLAIPLAHSGIQVVGIDNSAKMLEELKKKMDIENINNILYYHQDMQNIMLETKFEFILCPFCTFNFLLSIKEEEKALLAIRKIMKEESKIVFDLLTPYTFSGVFDDSSLKHFDSYSFLGEDSHIEIYISNKFNQCNQILSQERIYRKYDSDMLVTEFHSTMRNRLFFWGEFQLLLDKCGYKILDMYGDYKFSQLSPHSQSLIIVATLK